MYLIKLNDLLQIDTNGDDYWHGRITLNTNHLEEWLNRKDYENQIGPDFSFRAKNTTDSKTHLHENDLVIVAVQM